MATKQIKWTEAKLTAHLKNYLNIYEIFNFKFFSARFKFTDKHGTTTNYTTKTGIPDIIICQNGYFIAIEIKVNKAKLRPSQIEAINMIQSNNGICLVVSDSNLHRFKELMKQYNYDLKLVSENSSEFEPNNFK